MAATLWLFLAFQSALVIGFQSNLQINMPGQCSVLKVCNSRSVAAIFAQRSVFRGRNYGLLHPRSKIETSMALSGASTDQSKWLQFVNLCGGSWNALWSTYNFIGDMEDETIATVDLQVGDDVVLHNHIIPLSSITSNCDRCQDSYETRTIPVAQYSPGNLRRYHSCRPRLAGSQISCRRTKSTCSAAPSTRFSLPAT